MGDDSQMRGLFGQLVVRPLTAFIWSIEVLAQGVQGMQSVDAMVSRVVHTLCRPAREGLQRGRAPARASLPPGRSGGSATAPGAGAHAGDAAPAMRTFTPGQGHWSDLTPRPTHRPGVSGGG